MCGIFGILSEQTVSKADLSILASHAMRRGRDSSGLMVHRDGQFKVYRADYSIKKLLKKQEIGSTNFVFGHSRLITNGLRDNQPVVRNGIATLHNGIIVNELDIWKETALTREFEIDSEALNALFISALSQKIETSQIPSYVLDRCKGSVSAAVAIPEIRKLFLFSNNGSLFVGRKNGSVYFASERYPLSKIGCAEINQIDRKGLVFNIPEGAIEVADDVLRTENLIPSLVPDSNEERILLFREPKLKRCAKCILPETMPFITFDDEGVCNFCLNYKPCNAPLDRRALLELVEPYRRANGPECLIPFSGGRDSCYALHLVVNVRKMRPVT